MFCRHKIIGAVILCLSLLMINTAYAEGVSDGDACTTAGLWHQKNSPEGVFTLVCNGTTWEDIFYIDKDEQVGIKTTTISAGDETLEVDVNGEIGAIKYCDEDGNNCFTAAGVGGSSFWAAGSGADIYYNSGTPKVGIGTATPKAPLDVGGEIKIGTTTGLSCDSDRQGGIRYNTSENCIELCDGSDWGCIATAACSDATPDSYSFTDVSNQTISTLVASNIVQITGIGCPTAIGISGDGSPQFRICSDGSCSSVVQDWTDSQAFIDNDEYLQIRLTTNAAGGNTHSATITVGNGVDYWDATTTFPDCTGSPAVGTVCSDGTVYAGISLDGSVKMYTTRCDAGMSWSGATCTGTRSELPWNDGSSNYQTTSANSTTQGETNTTTLVGLTSHTDYPYLAADYCDDLTENGHTDWYLPSQTELDVLYNGHTAIGNFLTNGTYYWSSSENNNAYARVQRFSDGGQSNSLKHVTYAVRCARR